MNQAKQVGIILTFVGALVIFLVFLRLVSDQNPGSMVVETALRCDEPSSVPAVAFYAAVAGSALVTIGVWKTGFGERRIVREGSALVFSIGLIVLGLGAFALTIADAFASGFLPYTFTSSALIGYLFGLIGAALMIGGLVKNAAGRTNPIHPSSLL